MSLILRYANEDYDDYQYFWKARLTKTFELETLFEVSEKFGSQKRSIQLTLDNRDQELTNLHEAYSLLNKPVVLTYVDPLWATKTFYGVVTELNRVGLDIELTVSEELSLYMQQPLPDMQVAVDYYSDKGINDNWNAVPIIIGTVKRLKTQWVDLVFNRYIIGSGPLTSIDKVYFNDVIMYDKTRSADKNIFQTSDESKKIGVIIWRGTGWESDPETQSHPVTNETITSVYPGQAYLEFYNPDAKDESNNPIAESIAPVNADGSSCEIYVDVKGISSLESEPNNPQMERNPAKVLYQLATNPRTCNAHVGFAASEKGPRGYGLAIPAGKINFDAAISYCSRNSLVIDGVIAQRQEASEWFDELAKYCMATFKEVNGVLTLYVDEQATTVVAHFSDDGVNAFDCIIGDYSEPAYDKQINRIRLYYGYNVETDKFDKRPSGSEESPIPENSQYLRNDAHYAKLQKWNTDKYEYKFVQDDATAHMIAQYNFKRNILQLKTVDINIGFSYLDRDNYNYALDLNVMDVISITSTKHNWNRKQFRIKKIISSDKGIKLTCFEYDDNVYYDDAMGVCIVPTITYPETPRPDKPVLNSITSNATIAKDGTTDIILTFDYTLPENNCSGVEIYYKLNSPGDISDTGYTFLASSASNTLEKKWLFGPGDYRFRLVSVSPTGAKSFISKQDGDKHYYGQPGSETYLTINKDLGAPGKPIISGVTTIPYGVVFSLSITGGTPDDFDHYEIFRSIGVGEYLSINNNVKTSLFTDVNNTSLPYNTDIRYKVKAYDKSGNPSEFSDITSPVQVKFVVGDDITNQPIIAKDFRTSVGVGTESCGIYIPGVILNSSGLIGYNSEGKTLCLDASTGNLWLKGIIETSCGNIGGWLIGQNSIYNIINGCGYSSFASISLKDAQDLNWYPTIQLAYSCGLGCTHEATTLSIGRPNCGTVPLNIYGFSSVHVNCSETKHTFLAGGTEFGTIQLEDGDDPVPQNSQLFWVGNSTNYMRWRSDCNDLKLSGTIMSTSGCIGGIGLGVNGLGSDIDTSGTIKNGLILVSNNFNSLAFGCFRTGIYVYGYTFGPVMHSIVSINTNDYYDGSSASKAHINITVGSSACFAVNTNGNICANCLYQSSSRETKRNFEDIGSILECFDGINMVRYQRKDSEQWGFGLMAEDIQEKFPWMFDGKSVHGIDMFALKGVKELHQITKFIDARLKAIEEKINV